MSTPYSRLMMGAALVAPVVAVLAPRGMVIVMVATAVAATVLFRRHEGEWPSPHRGLAAALAVIVGWGVVTAAWSFSAADTLITAAKLTALFASGLALVAVVSRIPPEDRPTIRRAVVAGVVVALLLLAIEVATDGSIHRLVHGPRDHATALGLASLNVEISAIAVMAWSAAAALAPRRNGLVVAAMLAATTAVALAFESQTADVALWGGIAVWGVSLLRGDWVRSILRGMIVAAVLAAPVLPRFLPPPNVAIDMAEAPSLSVIHRISIWQFTADRIAEKPAVGWGLDSSRGFNARYALPMPPEFNFADMKHLRGAMLAYFKSQPLPLHPHNGVLQVWLELGAVGALPVLAVLLMIISAISRAVPSRRQAAVLTGQMIAVLVLYSSAFGAWQSWWQATLWISAALSAATVGEAEPGDAPNSA